MPKPSAMAVPTQGHQAALRGHRSTRLDCRGRAAHLDIQTGHRLAALGAAAARNVPARATRTGRLVQYRTSTHVAGRPDAARGVPRTFSRQPQVMLRAAPPNGPVVRRVRSRNDLGTQLSRALDNLKEVCRQRRPESTITPRLTLAYGSAFSDQDSADQHRERVFCRKSFSSLQCRNPATIIKG